MRSKYQMNKEDLMNLDRDALVSMIKEEIKKGSEDLSRLSYPLLLAEINRLKRKLATLESRALEPVKDGADMVHINHLYELYLLAKD